MKSLTKLNFSLSDPLPSPSTKEKTQTKQLRKTKARPCLIPHPSFSTPETQPSQYNSTTSPSTIKKLKPNKTT
jgi:hypothetical protein